MYHELSLIVLGILHQGAGGSSSHVMPTLACAMAGIYGCGILESARLNMKTRHCISGWGRVVHSGLWCLILHSHRTTVSMPLAVMADKDPPSPKLLGFTLVVASRHRKARSNPFMIDLCKICFPQKNIHFILSYLSDSKRQHSTTNVYSTAYSWQGLHLCSDKHFKPTIMETPEYIEGIPTEKNASRKRREIIKDE